MNIVYLSAAGQVAGQVSANENVINTIISVTVPAVISIIGFLITIISINNNFKNELHKLKSNVHIEKMADIPYEVLLLMQRIQDNSITEKELLREFKILMNTIYSYGSEKAILLVSQMQKENFDNAKNPKEDFEHRLMVFYVLLASQIKCDVTGIFVSPDFWFQMKLTDYNDDDNKEKIKRANNDIVIELGLNDKFLID